MRNANEKRLDYLFLIGYVTLIYGTLSATPAFFDSIERIFRSSFTTFIDAAVGLCVISVVFIFAKKLKGKPPLNYIGIAVILTIYAIWLIYYTPIIAEKLHFVEYGFLTYLALRAFRDLRPRWVKYQYTISLVALIGAGDELVQKVLPNRVCELRDMMINAIAGILALVLLICLDEA